MGRRPRVGIFNDGPDGFDERRWVLGEFGTCVGRMEQASDLRTTIAKNNALLDEGRVASLSQVSGIFWQSTYDGEFYWHRVGFLPKCLCEGIVQSPNVLEPIVVIWVPQKQVLGAVRPVIPI